MVRIRVNRKVVEKKMVAMKLSQADLARKMNMAPSNLSAMLKSGGRSYGARLAKIFGGLPDEYLVAKNTKAKL